MPACLDVLNWRVATPAEVGDFIDLERPISEVRKRSTLAVRTQLKPVDVYTYLKARFGTPNGFQNFLRKDDSNNLIHWDFNLKAEAEDIHVAGTSREIHFTATEKLTDEEWKELILAIKRDYRRVAREKSDVLHRLEKWVVFQNKYVSIAGLCADLHAAIVDAPARIDIPMSTATEDEMKAHQEALKQLGERANKLFGDALQLQLLTPIMAEAFINMIILVFSKDEVRNDPGAYDALMRATIPDRLELLSTKCVGFARSVDKSVSAYPDFMRVVARRNFALHGNVDPVREAIETIYFDGRRPLFVTPGHHIARFFEQLEKLYRPEEAVADYENVHAFLAEITNCMDKRHKDFFEQVITDAYPGYDVIRKRTTRLLPDAVAMAMFPGLRYDDELAVEW